MAAVYSLTVLYQGWRRVHGSIIISPGRLTSGEDDGLCTSLWQQNLQRFVTSGPRIQESRSENMWEFTCEETKSVSILRLDTDRRPHDPTKSSNHRWTSDSTGKWHSSPVLQNPPCTRPEHCVQHSLCTQEHHHKTSGFSQRTSSEVFLFWSRRLEDPSEITRVQLSNETTSLCTGAGDC